MEEKTLVRPVFTGVELRRLIVPLVFEQFLAVTCLLYTSRCV